MNGLAEIARKELRRRRLSTVSLFCLAFLLLLAAAYMLPRQYTASATLVLEPAGAAYEDLAARLVGQIEAAVAVPGHGVRVARRGALLDLLYSAPSPEQAFDGLSQLVSRLVTQERARLREALQGSEAELRAQAADAQRRVQTAEATLNAALSALPEGGEAALGARIGKLQGELDALAVDIRSSRELQRSLSRRAATLRGRIARLQQDLGDPDTTEDDAQRLRETLDTELQPQLNQAEARLATLAEELKSKGERERELGLLLEQGRAESSTLQEGNQTIRELQRTYDDAAALQRQLNVRLQELRQELELRTSVAALPFSTSRVPVPPRSPDGMPAWSYVLLAAAGALLVAGLRLLGSILIDDRVRLADTVLEEAEVPVLAVIPDYSPREAIARVRLRVVLVALLGAASVAAVALFLVLLG